MWLNGSWVEIEGDKVTKQIILQVMLWPQPGTYFSLKEDGYLQG